MSLTQVSPSNCSSCPRFLRNNGDVKVLPFEISDKCSTLYVQQSIHKSDVDAGKILGGEAGQKIRNLVFPYHQEISTASACSCSVKSNTPPTEDEIDHCSQNLQDVIKQNPQIKSVVFLGKQAARSVFEEARSDKVSPTKMSKMQVRVVDGVRYGTTMHPAIALRDDGAALDLDDRMRQISEIPGMNQRSLDYEIVNVDQLLPTLSKFSNVPPGEYLGLDLESNSLESFWEKFKILGFSISCTTGISTYINMDRDLNIFERVALTAFLQTKKPWIYNYGMEGPAFWRILDTEMPIDFPDAWMLMKVNYTPGSLKENARKLLRVSMWEGDQGSLVDGFCSLFEFMFDLQNKLDKKPEFNAMYNLLRNGDITIATDSSTKLSDVVLKYITPLREIISDEQIIEGLKKYDPNGDNIYGTAWEAVPVQITGEYCCYDSFYTALLAQKFYPDHKQYWEVFQSQAVLSGIMESYGLAWDEDKADSFDQLYDKHKYYSLRDLILAIKDKLFDYDDNFNPIDGTYYGDEAVKEIEKLKESENDPSFDYEAAISNLKDYFSPTSTKKSKLQAFIKSYMTPYTQGCIVLKYITEALDSEPLLSGSIWGPLVTNDVNTTLRNLLTAKWDENAVRAREKLSIVKSIVKEIPSLLRDHTTSFRTDLLEFQGHAFKGFGGVNFEDESTYTFEYQLLVLLRKYKKLSKSKSSYVNGKMGRANVWLAKLPDDIMKPPIRIMRYHEAMRKGITPHTNNSYFWVCNISFNPCGADTLRWRAGIHTVPWGNELRELFIPRSKSNLFVHADYGAMEVRALASIAQEQKLLDAFARGVDIHKFNASQSYNKPYDEVTDAERRSAKLLTFAVLYGSSIESMARDHFKGDIDATTKLVNGFYAAYPAITAWIKKQHAVAEEHGYCMTLFGNKIFLPKEDIGSLRRKSQNYPIQSSSSCVAGEAIKDLYDSCYQKKIRFLAECFTHDASDSEFFAGHLFEVLDQHYISMNDMPKSKYGMTCKIDIEIGTSQAAACVFEELERDSDTGYNKRTYTLSGKRNNIDEILERLEPYFDMEYEVTSEKDKKVPWSEMWITKKAFSIYLGTMYKETTMKITLTKKSTQSMAIH